MELTPDFSISINGQSDFPKDRVISIKDDCAVVDLEAYFVSCESYKSRKKMAHGTRYRIYHHPFIRNFLQSNIKSCQVYGNSKDGLLQRVVTGYSMATGTGEKMEIDLKEDGKVLPGFTGGEYALLMAFWSVYEKTEESVSMSAAWETFHGSRWSHQSLIYKERFFNECKSLIDKVNAMSGMCKSVKWNGRSVDPSVLFGAMGEDKGFYEQKTGGVGGSIGKMKRCHDCDSVSFFMSRPELRYQSGKSVLPIPYELLTVNECSDLHIYIAYRVLRKIKMGDKASPVILSETIEGLFGDWSRKSAKHYMEKLKKAGYIKEYKLTRRGIEFDVSENKKDGTTEP